MIIITSSWTSHFSAYTVSGQVLFDAEPFIYLGAQKSQHVPQHRPHELPPLCSPLQAESQVPLLGSSPMPYIPCVWGKQDNLRAWALPGFPGSFPRPLNLQSPIAHLRGHLPVEAPVMFFLFPLPSCNYHLSFFGSPKHFICICVLE